ncbi:GpE family phage tail protein [Thalassospira alkalitolerans]
MEEVAYTFHFQPSELERMKVSKLLKWHKAVHRIQKKLSG